MRKSSSPDCQMLLQGPDYFSSYMSDWSVFSQVTFFLLTYDKKI